jgi:nitrogen fixation negative regulator NifL
MPDSSTGQGSLRKVLQQALESGDDAMESLHNALPSPTSEQATIVNLNELLHEVIKLSTEKMLAGGIIVDWRPSPVLPGITGRANALRGLLKYLMDNALQALSESDQDYREIRLETLVDGHELVVEFMDNGPGVAKACRLKVFEPFFCGWNLPKGHAGMGLTMAQEVAIEHGGSVEIDPDFLGGCRVLVRLPIHSLGGE